MQVGKSLAAMLVAPVRMRRRPPRAPEDPTQYVIPQLAPSLDTATLKASDIPVVRTPEGGWSTWPPLVLAGCDEPLAEGAPDLRGVWRAHRGPMKGHVERVEQAGNRVVITAGGVIHDMVVDGTMAGGVHDTGVGGADIHVVARFEDGRHDLYLGGRRRVVTRYLDGDEMVWHWGPYTSRLHRLDAPDDSN